MDLKASGLDGDPPGLARRLRDLVLALVRRQLRLPWLLRGPRERASQTEEALGQLRAVVTSLTDGLVVVGLDGRVLWMNPAALQMHGFCRMEECPRTLRDFADAFELSYLDGRKMPLEEWPLSRLQMGYTFAGLEARVRRLDGGATWIASYSAAPVRDREGRVILSVLTVRDATARIEAEAERVELLVRERTARREVERLAAEVERQRRTLSAILEVSPVHVYLHDRAGRYIYASAAGARSMGLTPDRMTGWTWRELGLPPAPMGALDALRAAVFATGKPVAAEVRLPTVQGERDWDCTMSPVLGPDGLVESVVTTLADVTAHKKVEATLGGARDALEARVRERTAELVEANERLRAEIRERQLAEVALRESERRYRELSDALPQPVFEADRDLRVVFANRSALEAFGRKPQDVDAGISVLDLIARPDLSRAGRSIDRLLAGAEVAGLECRFLRSDGTGFSGLVYARPILSQGQTVGVRGVVVDVTELKRAEEAIRTLNENLERRVAERTAQLEQANRELEAFSYSVSHDLRAPLRAIDGFSRILLECHASSLSPEGRRYLDSICANTRRMGELIDDLLAFSRLSRQAIARRSFNLRELALGVAQELVAADRGRRVELTVGELGECRADPVLIRQVLANLVGNALKFTRTREVARIEVGCQAAADEQVYFVRDNGVGFDMQYAGKLFKVFQRLHRPDEFEGNGVGLAIVQRIVHRHGGRVWAEGAVDCGATFYFTLGRDADRAAAGEPKPA